MATLAKCFKKHERQLSAYDVEQIKGYAAEYVKEGTPAKEAKRSAVLDYIDDLMSEYDDVVKQVETQLKAKPKVEEKPVEPEVVETVEEVSEIKEKTVSVEMTKAEEESLSPKEQKAYLLEEIDNAIDEAPDKTVEIASKFDNEEKARETYERNLKNIGTVTIEVPGDGIFNILNAKQVLKNFKKIATKFPTTEGKIKGPGIATTRPSGKRLVDFVGYYYHDYVVRKEGLVFGDEDSNIYSNGFYSNGGYFVKTDKKPVLKGRRIYKGVLPDVKALVKGETVRGTIEGEAYQSEEGTDLVFVHITTEKGDHYVYNAKFVDSILTIFPDAKLHITEHGVAFFKDADGNVVGGMMKIRTAEDTLSGMPNVIQEGYSKKIGEPLEKERIEEVEKEKIEVENRVEDLKAEITSHITESKGLERGLEYYTAKFKNFSDAELNELLTWTRTQNAYISRFLGGNLITEMRSREVAIEEKPKEKVEKKLKETKTGVALLSVADRIETGIKPPLSIEERIEITEGKQDTVPEDQGGKEQRKALVNIFKSQGFDTPNAFKLLKPTTKEQKNIEKIAKRFGIDVSFFETIDPKMRVVGGAVIPTDSKRIFLNVNPYKKTDKKGVVYDDPVMFLAGHEFLHTLKRNQPELYKFLHDQLKKNKALGFDEFLEQINSERKKALPNFKGMDPEKAFEEFIADFVGSQFTNAEFWKELRRVNPTLTERILNFLQDILDMFHNTMADKEIGSEYFENINNARKTLAVVMGKYEERLLPDGSTVLVEPALSVGMMADPWFSQMEKFLSDKLDETSTVKSLTQSLKTWAKKGLFKDDELQWSGVLGWLKDQKGKITKQEVLDYLAENNVRVEEVVKGDEVKTERAVEKRADEIFEAEVAKIMEDYIEEHGEDLDYSDAHNAASWPDAEDQAREELGIDEITGDTKFGKEPYVQPGGKDYRELLLTLPVEGGKTMDRIAIELGYSGWHSSLTNEEKNNVRAAYEAQKTKPGEEYKSSHWDEPNVLAHIRFDERTGPKGEKILHIAELQSDWGAEGRRKGFKGELEQTLTDKEKKLRDLNAKDWTGESLSEVEKKRQQLLQREVGVSLIEKVRRSKGGVSPMPFPATQKYIMLAMKRMVRYSAENGFDAITWDPGEVQAERYDLSKQVDEITWNPNTTQLVAIKNGQEVINQNVAENKLADYVGKDISEKLTKVDNLSVRNLPKPKRVGELANDVFGRKMAALMPLDAVDGGVISMLHNNKIVETVVSRLPVNMVDILAPYNLSPQDIFSNPKVVSSRLSADSLSTTAANTLNAIRKTHTAIGTKLKGLSTAGRDIAVLPTLKASDLNSFEVVGIVSPRTIFHSGAGGAPKVATTAGTIAELLPSEQAMAFGSQLSSTELAKFLSVHDSIISEDGSLVKQNIKKDVRSVKGDDLSVPSPGMKSFYDKMFVNEVNKFFNKAIWGNAKVGTTLIETEIKLGDFKIEYRVYDEEGNLKLRVGDERHVELYLKDPERVNYKIETIKHKEIGTEKVWHLPITKQMRDKALEEGMPLFSVQRPDLSPLAQRFIDQVRKQDATPISEKTKEDLSEDGKGALDFVSKVWTNRKKGWKEQKKDTSAMDRILSIPLHHFDKVPALKRMFEDALERSDNYYEIFNDIDKTEQGESSIDIMEIFKKQNKDEYKKFKDYLVYRDRNQIGYKVWQSDKTGSWYVFDPNIDKNEESKAKAQFRHEKDALDASIAFEASDFKKAGFSDQAVQSLIAARRMTFNGFDILVKGLRDVVEKYKKAGMDLPEIAVMREGERVKINLKEALIEMGDMRGYYMPRIRKPGRFSLKAEKKGENPILEFYDSKSRMAVRQTALENKGYAVTKDLSRALPEDVFEMAGEIVAMQAMVNQALDRISPDAKDISPESAEEIKKALPDVELLFAKSLAEQIANVIKSRGHRAHMVKRSQAKGKDVWIGYEEDPIKSLAKYGRGIAAGEAKKKMAFDMVRHFTGTDVSWEDYKEQQAELDEEVEYKDYIQFVRARRVDPTGQPNAFKEGKTYMEDMLRNEEFIDRTIGTIKGIAVMKYLAGRVSAPIVNLTALITSVPAAMNGYADISYAKFPKLLGDASVYYGRYKFGEKGELDSWVRKAFDHGTDKGWFKAQYNREALSVLRSKIGRGWDTLMDWSMFAFGATEELNRASTIVGTYIGIKDKHKGAWTEKEHNEALALGRKVSDKAHAVYGKANRPHFARGSNIAAQIAQAFYVFRTFSHNYLLTMKELGFTPGKRHNALFMALSPAIISGVGASVLTPVIAKILSTIGFGDDPEEELYTFLENNVSESADDWARYGVFGLGGYGVSLKGSLQIGVMDIPTTIPEILGAPGSIIKDVVWEGIPSVARGDVWKGTEKILPLALSAPMKAYREKTEGVTTRKNAPVFYGDEQLKADYLDALYRSLSFNPSRMAGIREKQWKEKKLYYKYQDMRSDIYSKLKRFYLSPPGERAKDRYVDILNEIREYNERVKSRGLGNVVPMITDKSIKASVGRSFKPSKRERTRFGKPLGTKRSSVFKSKFKKKTLRNTYLQLNP